MARWLFIQCRSCGYSGCGGPIGYRCPSCQRILEPDPFRRGRRPPTEPRASSDAVPVPIPVA